MGTDEYPDRSTTLIIAVGEPRPCFRHAADAAAGTRHRDLPQTIAPNVQMRATFVEQWADNRAKFPRGVDVIFVADGHVAGLPRTTRIGEQ